MTAGGSVRALTDILSKLRRARRPIAARPAARLHTRVIVSGSPFLPARLVALHAAAGRVADALAAFRGHLPGAGADTAPLVSALARPHPGLAFALFRECLPPGPRVVSAALAACARLPPVCGRQVHACAVKVAPPADAFVYTGLVDAYAKTGNMAASRTVFDEMPSKGAASWNALVVGYARNCMCLDALSVFIDLAAQGPSVPLDQVSVSAVLSACTAVGAVDFGRQVHAFVAKAGLHPSTLCVSNALLDMYTRCGCSHEALALFDAVGCRDVVTWNIVIRGCIQGNQFTKACMQFRSMIRDGVYPDDVSFATALQASACMLAWALGASIHASAIKTGFLDGCGLTASLITMYSKCGRLEDARQAFEVAGDHLCVLTWTAMITALQQHGHGVQAIDMFETMLEKGISPDHITFVSVLSSCSQSGLIENGRKYFSMMTQVYKIIPWTEHYASMVDMFARAGLLDEAKQFIVQMQVKPDASVLGALLAGCVNCGDLEMGKEVAKKLFEIEPGNTGNYILLANIYTLHGRLEEANKLRRRMMSQELRKAKGCAFVNNEKTNHHDFKQEQSRL